ncbi:MAG: PDZ domain-containing protein [candidate division WOR-3 bacterium]
MKGLNAGEKRGWLGVNAYEPAEEIKIALSIDYGVIVKDVIEDSPAYKAGIKKGDIKILLKRLK